MPTLQERFADLAEDAPASPTPPGIWTEGRRRARVRRLGTGVVAAATVLGLATLGGVAAQRSAGPGFTGERGAAPALPTQVHEPSGWLSVGSRPPGQLSVVIPTKRTHLVGYTWGLVGVSATTGAYAFLDLPDYGSPSALSPDGRHLAYYLGTGPDHHQVLHGLAVYDTTTGRVARWEPAPGRSVIPQNVAWNGDDALTFTVALDGHRRAYFWRPGYGDPRPLGTRLGSLVGNAGPTGLYTAGPDHRYLYLAPDSGPVTRFRLAWPFRTMASTVAVSASGRMVAAVHANQRAAGLFVGRVSAGHRTAMRQVSSAALQWPVIVGWADDRHLVVVNQVRPTGYDGEGLSTARYALDRVDVRTGQVERISDVGSYWGPSLDYASALFGTPGRDFPAPPRPLGPRVELGLAGATVLVGGVLLLWWRRRARL